MEGIGIHHDDCGVAGRVDRLEASVEVADDSHSIQDTARNAQVEDSGHGDRDGLAGELQEHDPFGGAFQADAYPSRLQAKALVGSQTFSYHHLWHPPPHPQMPFHSSYLLLFHNIVCPRQIIPLM